MSYLVLIRGVLDDLGDSISLSDTLDISDIHLGEDVFAPTTPASFDVTLSNVGEAVIAQGAARARFRTSCVRCLCEFEFEVTAEVDGLFVQAGDEAGLPDEQDRELIVDGHLDLESVVVQSLAVELPFAPLHAEDCAGICPTCGVDRNEDACECADRRGSSPFARLKDAFPDPAHGSGERS